MRALRQAPAAVQNRRKMMARETVMNNWDRPGIPATGADLIIIERR